MPSTIEFHSELPLETRQEVERLLQQFKDACSAGKQPAIDDYLPAAGPGRLPALLELVQADREWRRRAGKPVSLNAYVERYPELAESKEVLGALMTGAGETASRGPEASQVDLDCTTASVASTRLLVEVVEGPHREKRFEFDRHGHFVVGRASTAHLSLPEDPFFSRHHFLLELNPPRCYLRDLGSRNGTLLNGNPVKEAFLKDRDIFGGGMTRIRLTVLGDRPGEEQRRLCVSCGTVIEPKAGGSRDDLVLCGPCQSSASGLLQVIPGYELHRKLAQGAMGVVYLARQLATGSKMALKVIVPESASSERMIQLFLREVNILSQLSHPRIVRFHEMGYARGQFFFVMDYVETVNLEALLTQASPAGRVRIACGILCQVLDALGYAHEKGLVHRDVKPANLLVSRHGKKLRVHLADFGLAKYFQHSGLSGMTWHGELRGSLPYMAPEQVLDSGAAGPAADIYSAGATLYQLLTGHTPHDFSPDVEPVLVPVEGLVVPLLQRCPELPSRLADIVHKALARAKEERFASAAEMRQHLLPLARGDLDD
jgi:serine/threonine-protein kinase